MIARRSLLVMLALLGATSALQAQNSILADPVKRNHFCSDHFPIFIEWQQCHDMWPYGGEATAAAKAKWEKCERSASNTEGKLDENKMAACLLKHIRG